MDEIGIPRELGVAASCVKACRKLMNRRIIKCTIRNLRKVIRISLDTATLPSVDVATCREPGQPHSQQEREKKIRKKMDRADEDEANCTQ